MFSKRDRKAVFFAHIKIENFLRKKSIFKKFKGKGQRRLIQ